MRPRARRARAAVRFRATMTHELAYYRRTFPGVSSWLLRYWWGAWAADWTGHHWKIRRVW